MGKGVLSLTTTDSSLDLLMEAAAERRAVPEKVLVDVLRSDAGYLNSIEAIVLLIVEVMEKIVVRCLGNT